MTNTVFIVPELEKTDCWLEYRAKFKGGYGWRADRSLSQIKYIVLHHSVSTIYNDADKEISQIANYHLNTNKWGGCGYHFIISTEERNGYAKVGYIGDIKSVRAHTPNLKGSLGIPARQGNFYTLGICLVGDFSNRQPTQAQIKSTHLLCNQLIYKDDRLSELKSWDDMKSHKDFDQTSCPGDTTKFRNSIINQKFEPVEKSGYEKALDEAKKWNDGIQKKYGFKLMHQVDKQNPSREDLLIILNNFNKYLDKK